MRKYVRMVLSLCLALSLVLCMAVPGFAAGKDLILTDVKVNSAVEPTGVDSNVYLSWVLNSTQRDTRQSAYQVKVSSGEKTVYNGKKIAGESSAYVPVDMKLKPATKYAVEVTSWDNHGNKAKGKTSFTSGKVNQSWDAKWITIPEEYSYDSPDFLFKKTFKVEKEVKKATLYGTALGCYVPFLNNERVGEEYFAPGYTEYSKRIQYNTYDITSQVKQGKNTLLTEVAPGWYTGRLGLITEGNQWDTKARALLQEVRIEYTDGSEDVIGTDDTWTYSTNGPRQFTSFFDGENYDANKTMQQGPFKAVSLYKDKVPEITENTGSPVTKGEKVAAKSLGNGIYDFGRNFAGLIHIKVKAPAGKKIHITHAEILHNGEMYTENLRTAKAEVNYITKEGEQEYEPLFTYMGFRYAQIEAEQGVEIEEVYGTELFTDMEQIGSFETSNADINQLQKNIITSQRANFVDIPTDCPQRDERSGWTGDISVFSPTAAYNCDITRFMRKWCTDMRLAQHKDGVIPMVVPDHNASKHLKDFYLAYMNDAVWGDAIIYVPWAVYESTGDISILVENYDAMKKWVGYELKQASVGVPYIWGLGGMHYGDWLAPDTDIIGGMTRADVTSTAYMAHSCDLLNQIATLMGKDKDAKYYRKQNANIKKAFQTYVVKPDGHLRRDFQSAYVLALEFDMLTDTQRKYAIEDLVANIEKNDDHLTTGFVGTPYLLFSLSNNGRSDKAYDLLFQDTCPSWLYEVKAGATSIWERWDSLQPDGTINETQTGSDNMVSFNHYAYGCVGDWMYRNTAGIQPLEAGYKKIRIKPLMDDRLTSAKSSHKTPYGTVSVSWNKVGSTFTMKVEVPCNTTAEIILPNGAKATVGSGTYNYTCNL